jgi:hypothetical protein
LEQPLRDQIPRLRAALRKMKTSGNGATPEVDVPPVDLVKPSRPNAVVEVTETAG